METNVAAKEGLLLGGRIPCKVLDGLRVGDQLGTPDGNDDGLLLAISVGIDDGTLLG